MLLSASLRPPQRRKRRRHLILRRPKSTDIKRSKSEAIVETTEPSSSVAPAGASDKGAASRSSYVEPMVGHSKKPHTHRARASSAAPTSVVVKEDTPCVTRDAIEGSDDDSVIFVPLPDESFLSRYEKDKLKNLQRSPGPLFSKVELDTKLSLPAMERRRESPSNKVLSSCWRSLGPPRSPDPEGAVPTAHPRRSLFRQEYLASGYKSDRE